MCFLKFGQLCQSLNSPLILSLSLTPHHRACTAAAAVKTPKSQTSSCPFLTTPMGHREVEPQHCPAHLVLHSPAPASCLVNDALWNGGAMPAAQIVTRTSTLQHPQSSPQRNPHGTVSRALSLMASTASMVPLNLKGYLITLVALRWHPVSCHHPPLPVDWKILPLTLPSFVRKILLTCHQHQVGNANPSVACTKVSKLEKQLAGPQR